MTDKVEKYQEMMDLFRLYFNFSKRFYGEENLVNLLLSKDEL